MVTTSTEMWRTTPLWTLPRFEYCAGTKKARAVFNNCVLQVLKQHTPYGAYLFTTGASRRESNTRTIYSESWFCVVH
jgi:hypothetical protein